MSVKIDWTKPLRFTKVQGNNHAHYQPKVVGSYLNSVGEPRHVVVTRHWDSAASVVIYDEYGKPLPVSMAGTGAGAVSATTSSGIFDPVIVNGDPITQHRVEIEGKFYLVTLDGHKPMSVEPAA